MQREVLLSEQKENNSMGDFYALKVSAIWAHLKNESLAFWMICCYLLTEYVRPQSIFPSMDFLPWAQLFIIMSAVGWFMDGQREWVSNAANKWMISFLILILLSSTFAVYPHISFEHIMDFGGYMIIYFLIINIVNSKHRFYIFMLLYLVAGFKLSQHGARTWTTRGFSFASWGLTGPKGPFQNSGEFSLQMLMFAPFAYQLAKVCKEFAGKWTYRLLILIPITAIMTVVGASSRGSQLGLLWQLALTFFSARIKFRAVVSLLLLGVVLFYALPDEQKARFTEMGGDKSSQQRLLYWEHGAEMILDNPVLGVGFYNFIPYYEAHYSEDLLYAVAQLPHNIFIQIGTDMGVMGLFVFFMLIMAGFSSTNYVIREAGALADGKYYVAMASAAKVCQWGFLVAGQFVTVTYYPFFWINLAFAVALKNIVSNDIEKSKTYERNERV